jgi:Sulfotransferase family
MKSAREVLVYDSKPLAIRLLNRLCRLLEWIGLRPRIDGEWILDKAQCKHGAPTQLDPLSFEGLMVRTRAYEAEANLSPFGRLLVSKDLVRCTVNQLAFERAYKEHPEILEERIKKPLFIVGMPRCGTTLMHRLMCCHAGARFIPFWEVHESVPRAITPSPEDTRRRIAAGRTAIWQLNTVLPELKSVHPITAATDPEECIFLFLCSHLLPDGFDFSYLPSYWRWMDELPDRKAPHIALSRQLKLLQWVRSGQHWVLKSPVHTTRLLELMEVFPDARVIYMERDPVESVASLCSLTALVWNALGQNVDLQTVGSYTLGVAERSRQTAKAALDKYGTGRMVRVAFNELITDPVRVAMELYGRFGYEHDPALEETMQRYMDANPREKHGRHKYKLADFGLDEVTVRQSLEPLADIHSVRRAASIG